MKDWELWAEKVILIVEPSWKEIEIGSKEIVAIGPMKLSSPSSKESIKLKFKK